MTEEDAPHSSGEIIEAFSGVRLPKPVVRSAWKAIGRLIGAAADIPVAWLEQFPSRIRSRTRAKEIISHKLAIAAGDAAATRDELVDRIIDQWIPGELRKQTNREAVAQVALEKLAEGAQEFKEPKTEIEDDWLNVFVEHAERASSERMRDLWGRVLAGEIRSPGRFSLRTLAFMSELDAEISATFERYLPLLIDDDLFRDSSNLKGKRYHELTLLAEVGLIKGAPSSAYREVIINSQGRGHVYFAPGAYAEIIGEPNHVFRYNIYSLTKVGIEVLSILPRPFDPQTAKKWTEQVPKAKLKRIVLRVSKPAGKSEKVVLWTLPQQSDAEV